MDRDVSTLTVTEVDTAIRVLAAESPDFIYNTRDGQPSVGCFYHKEILGDEPNKGCIFGQAFQRCGVDMDTVGGDSIDRLWNATHGDGEEIDKTCPKEWEDVQRIQDSGSTWGEAIKSLK